MRLPLLPPLIILPQSLIIYWASLPLTHPNPLILLLVETINCPDLNPITMTKEDSEKEVAENRYFVEFPGVQRGADVDPEGEVNAGAVAPVQMAQALMESLSEKKGVSCKWS